ncbi:hypothetical protein PR202_ga01793 [Eleusine coracana subsp. coracana]|uniref:Uncharacterized protein n=1 Tax=Eleusine coracana subsp. coracana TaxID=191504 RepID=A0AAV5BI23_ELECO|nr:hypothetical protein PR202_ga01106 [Eleusine coracana subsp. coracana]GJM85980.1 hypothetical protein PR202_ga01793 [Eleusine coracana subsp. coracana]
MGRSPCCEKEAGLKKGPWTPEEDQKLLAFIEQHGHGCWRSLPAKAASLCLTTSHVRALLAGPMWSAIATHLPKRTDNEIKNYWNTHLKKRLAKMGIDPVTHKPRADAPAAPTARYRAAAHLSHTAQWESARLEAEARLAREAKLRAIASTPQPAPQTQAASGLESPTSTLSFSAESALFAGAAQPVHTQQQQQHSYVDAFGEQHRFDEPASQQDGFLARVLLDCSVAGAEQGFAATSTDHPGAGEQGGEEEEEEEEEEDKGYWNSILNMVNSSMSSSSSSLTSEMVTDQAVYLPAAAEF